MVWLMQEKKQLPRGVASMKINMVPGLREAADAEAAKYGVSTSFWINHVLSEALGIEGPALPEPLPEDPPLAA